MDTKLGFISCRSGSFWGFFGNHKADFNITACSLRIPCYEG